jgi:hypothetical protein
MRNRRGRMAREQRTVEAMIELYCHGQHGTGKALCGDCTALLSYARKRLSNCPFQEGKTTCARCVVHCYRPDKRERIRAVMRYSGPRMLIHRPVLSLLHLVDRLRTEPVRRPRPVGGRHEEKGGTPIGR